MSELSEKVALVTGAAAGIGRAVALAYARSGSPVVVSDVDSTGGVRTVEMIEAAGGRAVFFPTDVSDAGACRALVRHARDTFGGLHIACNNAGVGGELKPTAEYSLEEWHRVLNINLNGVFYCLKYEIEAMLEGTGGAIVNVASILGQVSFPGAPAYVAAKHGVVGLTRNAAVEYAARGIRINAVGPAFIRTGMIAPLEKDPEAMKALVGLHPIGRLGTPEEVAELVLWLSSDRSSFVTGSYYPIDGGYLAR
jgi:NAD(P)-dependent dehydrogenase (short-subunit alcohol dehydrogenase family)